MKDKKNIVIKVRYPNSGNKAVTDAPSASHMKTEWNIKRISLALLGVVLITVALLFFLKHDEQKPEKQSVASLQPQTVLHPQATLPEKIVNSQATPKKEVNNNIIRALLTFKIKNNEPVGEITLPLKLSKKKSTSVYYFVELKAMKGRKVYHEWLLDGKLITRKKVKNIFDNTWRTSSRQFFAYSDRTNWTVRLVDETGKILNEIHFNVIYE